jgi:hypothetical protein
VVEHLRAVQEVLRDRERTVRVAGEQHALGEGGGGPQVDGAGLVLEGHGGGEQ